jgi:hypothetical protein
METAETNMQTATVWQSGPDKKVLKSRQKKQYACTYAGKALTIIEPRRFN